MSLRPRKPTSERIYVKGGKGAPSSSQRAQAKNDDITLLALQLACPRRWEITDKSAFENVHELQNIIAITVETKMFSSLVLVGTNSSKYKVDSFIEPLKAQLRNIIKSAHEKLYFIETFHLVDPTTLDWDFFVKMSDYCFLQETPQGEAFVGYFRLEKTEDEDRFASRSMDSMVEGEVAEQDVYLFFGKNNRYIKILNKGESVEKKRIDRLQSKGVKDLYVSADQGVEMQQRRIRRILLELLEDYSTLINAA